MFGMFGLGGPEIVLILVVVLLLFGAKKLPELARGLGSGIKEFKKATNDINSEVQKAMEEPVRQAPQTPQAPSNTTAATTAQTNNQNNQAPQA